MLPCMYRPRSGTASGSIKVSFQVLAELYAENLPHIKSSDSAWGREITDSFEIPLHAQRQELYPPNPKMLLHGVQRGLSSSFQLGSTSDRASAARGRFSNGNSKHHAQLASPSNYIKTCLRPRIRFQEPEVKERTKSRANSREVTLDSS